MWHPGQRPLLWGPTAQTQRPLSHFSLSLLSSLSSSSDPYPAWRALCFIWPAGLLHSHCPLHATTAPKYSKKSHHQRVLRETAASNWACFSSWRLWVFSSPRCSQGCKQQNTLQKIEVSVRWQWGQIAWCLKSKLTIHNTHYMLWKSCT